MMFGRSLAHSGELSLEVLGEIPADAFEVARFWVNTERSFVAVGRPEGWNPELLGSLLAECLQTAAAAYAGSGGMTEAEAAARLWQAVDDERTRLTSQTGLGGEH